MASKKTAIDYIKAAIKTLDQPVQYSMDVNDPRELRSRVEILRDDAACAKRELQKAIELFEIKD